MTRQHGITAKFITAHSSLSPGCTAPPPRHPGPDETCDAPADAQAVGRRGRMQGRQTVRDLEKGKESKPAARMVKTSSLSWLHCTWRHNCWVKSISSGVSQKCSATPQCSSHTRAMPHQRLALPTRVMTLSGSVAKSGRLACAMSCRRLRKSRLLLRRMLKASQQ